MGTTFYNFHVKHSDAGEVGAVVADEGGAPFEMSATAEGGWLSVYPESMSATRKLARDTSSALAAPVLVFEVYDSDVCTIVLYNAGKRVSRFVNEYEGEPAEPGEEDRFARYAARRDPAAIRRVLDVDEVFSENTAIHFAQLFGLPKERVMCGHGWFRGKERPAWLLAAE
jgi:hypothetical protein